MPPQSGPRALERIEALDPYSPGLSIDEIRQKYGLERVVKMASNENPLGASPLAVNAVRRHAPEMFRYPRGGNPRLVAALAAWHGIRANKIVVGNGSDEIIDLLIRMLAQPGLHNIVRFDPSFSIYPIQARIHGVEVRGQPLEKDFSFNFDALLNLTDGNTRLVFITTPDNPSGYCPPMEAVHELAAKLAVLRPEALLIVDEAYIDFADNERDFSLLANNILPENTAFLRTFSKSWGLAGMRVGYGILPERLAESYWRARLPFSVGVLSEEAALATLKDYCFREATLTAVREGRRGLQRGLEELGCQVWPSQANFLLFQPPARLTASRCYQGLLEMGIIIRPLNSYALPGHLRVSVGNPEENKLFLKAMRRLLAGDNKA